MNILFYLVMRYVDYDTFFSACLCSKESRRICNILILEFLKIKKDEDKYEIYWKNKKHGLCYYINDSYLKIMDYEEGKIIALYVYSYFTEYIEVYERRYNTEFDYKNLKVILPDIATYKRKYLSLIPISHSPYLN